MAVGFFPKYIQEFSLPDLTQQQSITFIKEALLQMDWNISHIGKDGIIAYTKKSQDDFYRVFEIKIIVNKGIGTIQSASIGTEIMDWGKNKENVVDFVAILKQLQKIISKEDIDSRFECIKVEDDLPARALHIGATSTTEKLKNIFFIFWPSKGYFITPFLININIIIFILMVTNGVDFLQPDNASLLNWGANFRPYTLDSQWWRLITNCFLHIGIMHLIMNMYALLFIGFLLEHRLGRSRFLSAYLLTGITASATSLWWHDLTISAGASGAIFGLYGVFLAMLTTDLVEKAVKNAILTSIVIFVGYNLLNGFKEGIDNAAHIGGLICGLVIGYAFIPSLKKTNNAQLKFGTIGLTTILVLASSFIIYTKTPNDIGNYNKGIKEFVNLEEKALEVLNLPSNTPKETILFEIKNHGLEYWQKSLRLIDSLGKLKLPLVIKERNQTLKKYCQLRIQSYELIYKQIAENTEKYSIQIDQKNQQIKAILSELNDHQAPK